MTYSNRTPLDELRTLLTEEVDLFRGYVDDRRRRSHQEYSQSVVPRQDADVEDAFYSLTSNRRELLIEYLVDLIYRWLADRVIRDDYPGFRALEVLNLVEIGWPVHGRTNAAVLSPQGRLGLIRLRSLMLTPDNPPTAISERLRRRFEIVTSTRHVNPDAHFRSLFERSEWIDDFVENLKAFNTQVDFSSIAFGQDLEYHHASAVIGSDAQEFDGMFRSSDEEVTSAEMGRGVNDATDDLNWALNLIGPPPAPTDTSSHTPTSPKPLGSKR